jgi:hypothetical protein
MSLKSVTNDGTSESWTLTGISCSLLYWATELGKKKNTLSRGSSWYRRKRGENATNLRGGTFFQQSIIVYEHSHIWNGPWSDLNINKGFEDVLGAQDDNSLSSVEDLSSSYLPLKTSLNSPGGACRMKSEAIRTYERSGTRVINVQTNNLEHLYLHRPKPASGTSHLLLIGDGRVVIISVHSHVTESHGKQK